VPAISEHRAWQDKIPGSNYPSGTVKQYLSDSHIAEEFAKSRLRDFFFGLSSQSNTAIPAAECAKVTSPGATPLTDSHIPILTGRFSRFAATNTSKQAHSGVVAPRAAHAGMPIGRL
jgi:hypothetical protein